jgi:hypothetical protein
MRKILWLNLFLLCLGVSDGQSADLPKSFIDFDKQVSFSKPLLISIFRGFNDDHIYYIIPNVISVLQFSPGVPGLSLIYDQIKKGHRALLTIRGSTSFSADYEPALTEIKNGDPAAKFVVPEPYSFSFTIATPGSDGGGATIESAQINSAGHFEILVKVADITARILLLPNSYKFDSMAVIYSPVYHGVARTADGTPQIVERHYDVSFVSNGGCAFDPEHYVSWTTGHTGCVFPRYNQQVVYSIQQKLRKLGFYKYRPDGLYGPQTNAAIKRYQLSRSIAADGIPSTELVELINKERAESAVVH